MVFFACKNLISVESNKAWHEKVKIMLNDKRLSEKVDLCLHPFESEKIPDNHPYVNILSNIADESLDFALVDGLKMRVQCMEKVIPKLKPGGLLILDNSERFIPNKIMGQYTTSIIPCNCYPDIRWNLLHDKLHSWRELLTTNGIWDTRFWIKPV